MLFSYNPPLPPPRVGVDLVGVDLVGVDRVGVDLVGDDGRVDGVDGVRVGVDGAL